MHKVKLSCKNIQAKVGRIGKYEENPEATAKNGNVIDLHLIIATITGHDEF